MPVDSAAFRAAMGRLVAGVAVVSVRDGERALGMTASALASVSLEPPMLLVCVDRSAALHDIIVIAAGFGVNVLAEDQRALAERFSLRERQHWDESSGPTSPAGHPLAPGALAQLDCRRSRVYDGGDHSIVTGVVEWVRVGDGSPLCYYRSGYAGLAFR